MRDDRAVEIVRRELVTSGMKPYHIGLKNGRRVEFISYPWQAGQELFVLIRKPNRPSSVECVTVEEVEPTGESQPLPV